MAPEQEIIEKIDIGGISLIRAAAKNYKDVLCVSSMSDYKEFLELLNAQGGETSIERPEDILPQKLLMFLRIMIRLFLIISIRRKYKARLKISETNAKVLRYGENPHQKGFFFGDFDAMFDKLHGKELSYNNLLDVDAAINLMEEFKNDAPTFAILKHNNACGLATRSELYTRLM